RCRLTLLARYKEQISFVIEFTLSVPDPSIKAQARVKAVFPVEMQLGGGVAFLQVEFIGLGRHLQSEAAIVVVILVLVNGHSVGTVEHVRDLQRRCDQTACSAVVRACRVQTTWSGPGLHGA